MRKMINENTSPITEVGYRNRTGNVELVTLAHPQWVHLKNYLGDDLSKIYYDDIPKLITALQEAHAINTAQKAAA